MLLLLLTLLPPLAALPEAVLLMSAISPTLSPAAFARRAAAASSAAAIARCLASRRIAPVRGSSMSFLSASSSLRSSSESDSRAKTARKALERPIASCSSALC